jgi:hypothetical protein
MLAGGVARRPRAFWMRDPTGEPLVRKIPRFVGDTEPFGTPPDTLDPRHGELNMKQMARFVHTAGLVLLLGSILTFLVASSVGKSGVVVELAVVRRVIGRGTTCLTLPGLALLIASGVALVLTGSGMLKKRWVQVMAIATIGVVANGVLVVMPAVRAATDSAAASLAAGHLVAGYEQAFHRETFAGNINILLAVVAMIAGVWGTGARR